MPAAQKRNFLSRKATTLILAKSLVCVTRLSLINPSTPHAQAHSWVWKSITIETVS